MPSFVLLPVTFVRGLTRTNASSLRFQLAQQSRLPNVRLLVRSKSTVPPKSTPNPAVRKHPSTGETKSRPKQSFMARLARSLRERPAVTDPNSFGYPPNRQGVKTVLRFCVAGFVFYTCAFLDVKFGTPFRSDDAIPDRANDALPQTWHLTPEIVQQSIPAFWKDLDGLTLYFSASLFAAAMFKAKPWRIVVPDLAILFWFLPSVVHSLEHDGFHAFAVVAASPAVATAATEVLAYKFRLADGRLKALATGSIAMAALGYYSVKYANEKVWAPPGVALRVDAWVWAAGYVALQVWNMASSGRGSVMRMQSLCRIMHIGYGAAYAYFDLHHHMWIPLASTISGAREDEEEIIE